MPLLTISVEKGGRRFLSRLKKEVFTPKILMKFTKCVPCLKAVLILVLICCFGFTAAAANYYPAEVGNTWVFLSVDGSEQRTYTLEGTEQTDVQGLIALKITNEALGTDVSVTDTYLITVENEGGLLLHQSETDELAFGIAEATYDPPVTFFPAELPLGHTWQIIAETQLILAGAVTSTSTITVVAIEDVETPAGVFQDSVKLEIKQNDVTVLGVFRQTSYQWLAPDIGPVKYSNEQDVLYELEHYNLVEPTAELTQLAEDINKDGVVNIQDLVLVASSLGKTGPNTADINGDDIVDIRDLVKVAGALGTAAAAPTLHQQLLKTLTATEAQKWLSQAQHLDLTEATTQRGVRFLEQFLAAFIPKETILLANYPNPFNPETWIPYQLAEATDVTLYIYTLKGTLVRTLALGHQPAGMYRSRSRAAYWDGRNQVGEPVASGLYFYTLTAGDFTATRKMLILK